MLTGGIDEVGRGALAGPIISVIAVFGCEESPIVGITDSKKFNSRKKREIVFREILECKELVDFGIGQVDADYIDRMGIEEANALSFYAAVKDLTTKPDYIIVDGLNTVRQWPLDKQLAVPKADNLYWQVSAASILAKVIRDNLMAELSDIYPEYSCWKSSSGYGTNKHYESLESYPPTMHHRRTFLTK